MVEEFEPTPDQGREFMQLASDLAQTYHNTLKGIAGTAGGAHAGEDWRSCRAQMCVSTQMRVRAILVRPGGARA